MSSFLSKQSKKEDQYIEIEYIGCLKRSTEEVKYIEYTERCDRLEVISKECKQELTLNITCKLHQKKKAKLQSNIQQCIQEIEEEMQKIKNIMETIIDNAEVKYWIHFDQI